MGKQSKNKLIGYLPLVFGATFLVVVVPMLLVLWLRASGVVTSVWLGMAIGVVVSFVASYLGAALWKTRTDSRDILFSELMVWGWVQRWRSERRLTQAADLLGLTRGRPQAISGKRLTNEQKAGLLTQLTSSLEARDAYTLGHSRRVARHAVNIAKRMGLSREEVAKIRAAGAMHDVGKVETPIAVLHKDGKLTDEEYAVIKRHPVDGAVMVSTLRDPGLTAMVRHHHERIDGKGYPDGLAGEAIPLGARILAVADTFDAITSTRPYRHAHAHKKALDILVADAGTQLDLEAVRAFCGCYSGRRPLAYWTILAHGRPRLASLLGGGLMPAEASTVANVVATAATAAAVGAALGPAMGTQLDSSQAAARTSTSPASSRSQPRPVVIVRRTFKQMAAASGTVAPPSPKNRPGQGQGPGKINSKATRPMKASSPKQTRVLTKSSILKRASEKDEARSQLPADNTEKPRNQQTTSSPETASSGQTAGSQETASGLAVSPLTASSSAPASSYTPATSPPHTLSPQAAGTPPLPPSDKGNDKRPDKCEDKGEKPKDEHKHKNGEDKAGGHCEDKDKPTGEQPKPTGEQPKPANKDKKGDG